MKHTIKTGQHSGLTVTDSWCNGDEIFLHSFFGDQHFGLPVSDEAAAALIFALEQALEARQLRRDRVLKCAGDGLCSAPGVACKTPIACGVAA